MTGKLVAPPDAHWNLSETKGLLMQDLPAFPIPPDVKSKGRRTQDEWFQKWKLTEEGQAFLSQPRKKYDLCVGSDGSFSIANVVPGDCWLCYSFHDPLENELVCMGKKTFSLSAGSTPFASGDIQMTVRPHLKNGERAPRFQATAGGSRCFSRGAPNAGFCNNWESLAAALGICTDSAPGIGGYIRFLHQESGN